MIPQDPMILLSYLNTKLRDEYKSLDLLCNDLQLDKSDIIQKMSSIDYAYDDALIWSVLP